MTTTELENRPDYSPREVALLKDASIGTLKGTSWVTNEDPPRMVTVKGQFALDPDITIVEVEGLPTTKWLITSGTRYDGNIVGTDIWVRETI